MTNSSHSSVQTHNRATSRGILRTLFMPEIKLSFGTVGMTHRAFLSILATMFIQAGLLPYNHPARSMETIGHMSFRSIMGEAWFNLRNSGKNDFHQYGLFFTVFLLIAMAIMMVATFAGQLFMSSASAALPGGLFASPAPDTDIGLLLIDELIGKATRGEGAPHGSALGELFSIYSYGVLVIASFIVAWSIISIVVDTAATGKFFGGRHNPVWWPIRLVFGLALLVPLGHGFSTGQYLVVQIAKWGSNLASNAWYIYVEAVVADGTRNYVANQYPTSQVFSDFKNIAKINLCRAAVNKILIDKEGMSDALSHRNYIAMTINPALGASDAPRYVFTFGEQGDAAGVSSTWWNPTTWRVDKDKCGTITLERPAARDPKLLTADPNDSDWNFLQLANQIMIASNIDDELFATYAELYSDAVNETETISQAFVETYMSSGVDFSVGEISDTVTLEALKDRYDIYFRNLTDIIERVAEDENGQIKSTISEVRQYGWPTAALWYYIISSSNQKLNDAYHPTAGINVGYHDFKDSQCMSTGGRSRNTKGKCSPGAENLETQRVYQAFDEWWENQTSALKLAIETDSSPAAEDRILLRALDEEGEGEASVPTNAEEFKSKIADEYNVSNIMEYMVDDIHHAGFENNVHPIVLMANIGQKMINYAETIILSGLGVAATFAILSSLPVVGSIAAVLSQLIAMISGMAFLIVGPLMIGGVILSIILPMTPFIRFVFAISGWMIAIIEAVVMVPIVAIGHLRTDGEGIMGPMVQGVYVMMLQLLVRPVLIVIGLVLSMFLVEVTVGYINTMFFAMLDTLPVGSSQGWFLSSLVRFVGFGVMYGVLMYGLINSSFKLVDILPEAVVKYLGGGPSGGVTDRDEGEINRAVLASAVFASNFSSPVSGMQKNKKPDDEKNKAEEG